MKFIPGEFFLLPSSKAMVECKVSGVNGNKDKVTFTLHLGDRISTYTPQYYSLREKANEVISYFNAKGIRATRTYNDSLDITFRASEVCHHIKPLGEAFNLIYAN